MRRTAHTTLLLSALLTLCGCVQSKLEVYLNPDGSGKVVYEVVRGTITDELAELNEDRDNENEIRKSALSILKESKGVAAWRDVTAERTKERQFRFKGTAYFKDLNKLVLMHSQFALAKTRGPDLGMHVTASIARDPDEPDSFFEEGWGDEENMENLSVEELMKKFRADYLEGRAPLAAMLNVLQSNLTLHLPSAGVGDGFKEKDEAVFTLEASGNKILQALDDCMKDDVWLRARAEAARRSNDPNLYPLEQIHLLYPRIFGSKGKPFVETAAEGKPLFDFDKELAEAKAAYPKILASLAPLPVRISTEVLKGEPVPATFEELRPGGVVLNWEKGGRADKFGSSDWTYSLSWIGEMPRTAIGVLDGRIETAIASDGTDLFLERYPNQIKKHKLSKYGSSLVFDLEMRQPKLGTRGLRELSGYLIVAEDDGLREADLGILDMKRGTKVKTLNAEITELFNTSYSGRNPNRITVRVDVPSYALKEILFYDGDKQMECEWSGTQTNLEYTPIDYRSPKPWPSKCRVKVRYHALKAYRYPFKFTNITLLGEPMDANAAAAPLPAAQGVKEENAAEAPGGEKAVPAESAAPAAKDAAAAPPPAEAKEDKEAKPEPEPEKEKPKLLGDPKAVFVLRSGTRVKAYMFVDAGDRYSVKDETGRFRIVMKEDVEEILDK